MAFLLCCHYGTILDRWIIRLCHTNVTWFDCAWRLQEKPFVVNMSCCAVRCHNCETVQKELKFHTVGQITVLFMLMTDNFGWRLLEEMTGMITKLKLYDFAELISYQVSYHSVSQSVVICGDQFQTKIKQHNVEVQPFSSLWAVCDQGVCTSAVFTNM